MRLFSSYDLLLVLLFVVFARSSPIKQKRSPLKPDPAIPVFKSGSRPPSPETFWPPLGHVGLNSDDDSMAPSVASSHSGDHSGDHSEPSLSGHEDEPHHQDVVLGGLRPRPVTPFKERIKKEQAMAQTQGQPEASSSRHPPNSGHEGHSEASSSRHPPNSHHDGQSEASSSKSPPSPQDNHPSTSKSDGKRPQSPGNGPAHTK